MGSGRFVLTNRWEEGIALRNRWEVRFVGGEIIKLVGIVRLAPK